MIKKFVKLWTLIDRKIELNGKNIFRLSYFNSNKTFSTKRELDDSNRIETNNSIKDNFFYDKENIDKSSPNIINIQKNKKMISKLKLNENNSQPLVENEAYRELYRNFSLIVSDDLMKSLDEIKHNETENETEYRYGLPVKNNKEFTALIPIEEQEELPRTGTENLFNLLQLDKESSYESLLLKFQMEFNHEADMYGNVIKAGDTHHKVFEYGVPIPMDTIKNDRIMAKIRRYALYNVDLPGNIEDVHPNKFIANLRPVEEFRHTPVVPIPEKDIKEFKKKIEDKRRMGVYFEIKKQTIYYYGIAILFSLVLFQTFKYFYRESENTQSEIEKIRLRRLRYREEEDIN